MPSVRERIEKSRRQSVVKGSRIIRKDGGANLLELTFGRADRLGPMDDDNKLSESIEDCVEDGHNFDHIGKFYLAMELSRDYDLLVDIFEDICDGDFDYDDVDE